MSSSSASVLVEKATSDLLIGPDWTLNIEICDAINSDHGLAKDVVKAVKKRLQHKSGRVQFYALTLLETMMKNCGDFVHFLVVERDILQEMVKIVKKKTDMQVRDKILVLLDSWQEAFGGPGGKYPQYYASCMELRQFGVQFPQRSPGAAPIFTPPVSHPPNNPSSMRLEEAMASDMGDLGFSDLDSIRSVTELLSDMLRAANVGDRAAVKDDVIEELVGQCRANQKKLVYLVNNSTDEELLAQGLLLNDSLQTVLAKHDALASGLPLPAEPSASDAAAGPSTPTPTMAITPTTADGEEKEDDDEDDDDDEFSQLARRNSKAQIVPSRDAQEEAAASSPVASSYALALPDPPAPVKTSAEKEQDLIDLLSITLVPNPSPPQAPLTPPSVSPSAGGGQVPSSPPAAAHVGYTYNMPQQPVMPYNSYVVPWAQQIPPPQFQAQPPPSSSYPPPPWASTEGAAASSPQHYRSPAQQSPPFSQQKVNSPRTTPVATTTKPSFVPSYRLFEDLVDMRKPGPEGKAAENQPMISRK